MVLGFRIVFYFFILMTLELCLYFGLNLLARVLTEMKMLDAFACLLLMIDFILGSVLK